MSKKIISRGMKIFMTTLLVIGIGCYIAAGVVLYNSNYKISNYYDNIREFMNIDQWNNNLRNFSETVGVNLNEKTQVIEIRTSFSDIQVLSTDEPTIRVEGYGDERSAVPSSVSLNITEQNDANNTLVIGLRSEEYLRRGRITVYIPRNYKNNINISSTSGDIWLREMALKSISTKNTSGDVEIHNSAVDNLDIKTISGDINVQNSKSMATNFSTTSGDVNISGEFGDGKVGTTSGEIEFIPTVLSKDITIESTSGEVTIYINRLTNCGVDFSSVSGTMYVNEKRIKSNGGKASYNLGEGTPKINVKTTSGGLEIE